MKKLASIMTLLLIVGVVDQVEDNMAVVEYDHKGSVRHSRVNLDLSACRPQEGQTVYFYRDYKIVTCVEKNK